MLILINIMSRIGFVFGLYVYIRSNDLVENKWIRFILGVIGITMSLICLEVIIREIVK